MDTITDIIMNIVFPIYVILVSGYFILAIIHYRSTRKNLKEHLEEYKNKEVELKKEKEIIAKNLRDLSSRYNIGQIDYEEFRQNTENLTKIKAEYETQLSKIEFAIKELKSANEFLWPN